MDQFDFSSARLTDFDTTKAVEEDIYTLAITKVEPRTFTYKKGPNVGEEGQLLSVTVTIVDHEKYSGRRLYESFFPSSGTLKIFSVLSRVLGVPQEDGEEVTDWITRIANTTPPLTFATRVTVVESNYKTDANGAFVDDNKIQWFEAQPA